VTINYLKMTDLSIQRSVSQGFRKNHGLITTTIATFD